MMQYYKDSELSTGIEIWKLCIFAVLVLASMLVHFFLALFAGLLTTGIIFEWTLYFLFSGAILIWTWINHLISLRIICNQSLVQRIRQYMILSYCIQLAIHAVMALPIFGYYASYPDARGLWIAVGYAGTFNWILLACVFAVFLFLIAPSGNSQVGYAYVPVSQPSQQREQPRVFIRQEVDA